MFLSQSGCKDKGICSNYPNIFTLFHTIFAESSHLTKHQHITSKTFSGAKPASTPSSPKIDGKHTFEQNKNTRSGKTNPLEIPDNNPRHFTPQGINKHKILALPLLQKYFRQSFPAFLTPNAVVPAVQYKYHHKRQLQNSVVSPNNFRFILPVCTQAHRLFHQIQQKIWTTTTKLTTQTKINQIPPQQYLIYISTYRPSFTLKLPDILPSERDLACPNYKLPPKSATKQS